MSAQIATERSQPNGAASRAEGANSTVGLERIAPKKGLTFRKGKRESNVHDVKDGIVFYGVYLDGDDLPAGLYQATLDEWNKLATQAVEHGAEVFTMVRANAQVQWSPKAIHCNDGLDLSPY